MGAKRARQPVKGHRPFALLLQLTDRLAQAPDGLKVDTVRMRQRLRGALLEFRSQQGKERPAAGRRRSDGRRLQEGSAVQGNSHHSKGCDQPVQVRPRLDGSAPVSGCVGMGEQELVPLVGGVLAGLPPLDLADHAARLRHGDVLEAKPPGQLLEEQRFVAL